MGKGRLKIDLFLADETLPAGGLNVLVRDLASKEILYELTADENGITPLVELDAPDRESSREPYSSMPRSGRYEVEVLAQNGYKKVIVRGVEVFDGETSILPVQIHPAIEGDTPEENTDEIFIPEEHGVDADEGRGRSRSGRERNTAPFAAEPPDWEDPLGTAYEYANPTTDILANDIAIPTYITVHLGSPNASARNVRVPFADYIKNVASAKRR